MSATVKILLWLSYLFVLYFQFIQGCWICRIIGCGSRVFVIINQLAHLPRPQFDIILHQDLIDALRGWIELKLMHSSDNSIIISILFALCSEDSSISSKPTRTRTPFVKKWPLHCFIIYKEINVSVRVNHLTRPSQQMWWWPVRACAPTSPRACSSPPVPSTSPGSPSTIRAARWSSGAGHTTDLRLALSDWIGWGIRARKTWAFLQNSIFEDTRE